MAAADLQQVLAAVAAIALMATAIVHSWLGERRIVGPLLSEPQGILRHRFARSIVRGAWHITSITWLILAVVLLGVVFSQTSFMWWTLLTVGVSFLTMGVLDALASRFRHVGWPLLTLIGAVSLAAAFA